MCLRKRIVSVPIAACWTFQQEELRACPIGLSDDRTMPNDVEDPHPSLDQALSLLLWSLDRVRTPLQTTSRKLFVFELHHLDGIAFEHLQLQTAKPLQMNPPFSKIGRRHLRKMSDNMSVEQCRKLEADRKKDKTALDFSDIDAT